MKQQGDTLMNATSENISVTEKSNLNLHGTIWRWHFYAGLFCIPFILLLSITGGIYLFNPQVESQLDQPYEGLTITGVQTSAEAQVAAALAAVPGSVLNAYVLPATPQSAVRVLVGHDAEIYRVYVHPETLAILKVDQEDRRIMRVIHRLHGELLLGDRGSMIVELAASWAIVMFITGLYLWWPRNAQSMAGIVYPRLGRGKRLFWRDIHAVTGLWITFFTLFLLISGLPWAKSWGGMLKEIRQIGVTKVVTQDWTTGRSSELADRREMNDQAAVMADMSEHAGHHHGDAQSHSEHDYSAIDRLVATVRPLNLAAPVQISPPSKRSPNWSAHSLEQNRPLRADVELDGLTGEIQSRKNFADRPLFDRMIGIGVAAHEGQLFGWQNQLLGVFTALGLVLMTTSSVVLWLSRRTPGTLGAPQANSASTRFSIGIITTIVIVSVLLPLLGISLILITLAERFLLRNIPSARNFLGLGGVSRSDVIA
jgi:uncharacterized iron-regulated membrane protein